MIVEARRVIDRPALLVQVPRRTEQGHGAEIIGRHQVAQRVPLARRRRRDLSGPAVLQRIAFHVLFGLVVGAQERNCERTARADEQLATDGGGHLIVDVLAEGRVRPTRRFFPCGGDADARNICRKRDVQYAFRPEPRSPVGDTADLAKQVAAEGVEARRSGDIADGPAHRTFAIERGLRPPQDLHALHVEQPHLCAARGALVIDRELIHIITHSRQAEVLGDASKLDSLRAGADIDDPQAGHRGLQLIEGRHATVLNILSAERADRDGNINQTLRTTLRSDDHIRQRRRLHLGDTRSVDRGRRRRGRCRLGVGDRRK